VNSRSADAARAARATRADGDKDRSAQSHKNIFFQHPPRAAAASTGIASCAAHATATASNNKHTHLAADSSPQPRATDERR
jgi:hypothetical protein